MDAQEPPAGCHRDRKSALCSGHLRAAKAEDVYQAHFAFPVVLEGVQELFKQMGIERERIPLIVAGGIKNNEQVLRDMFTLGASAVQLGTAFAVSEEGDAHLNFKKVVADAKPEDTMTFMTVAGLPASAVRTPWLDN